VQVMHTTPIETGLNFRQGLIRSDASSVFMKDGVEYVPKNDLFHLNGGVWMALEDFITDKHKYIYFDSFPMEQLKFGIKEARSEKQKLIKLLSKLDHYIGTAKDAVKVRKRKIVETDISGPAIDLKKIEFKAWPHYNEINVQAGRKNSIVDQIGPPLTDPEKKFLKSSPKNVFKAGSNFNKGHCMTPSIAPSINTRDENKNLKTIYKFSFNEKDSGYYKEDSLLFGGTGQKLYTKTDKSPPIRVNRKKMTDHTINAKSRSPTRDIFNNHPKNPNDILQNQDAGGGVSWESYDKCMREAKVMIEKEQIDRMTFLKTKFTEDFVKTIDQLSKSVPKKFAGFAEAYGAPKIDAILNRIEKSSRQVTDEDSNHSSSYPTGIPSIWDNNRTGKMQVRLRAGKFDLGMPVSFFCQSNIRINRKFRVKIIQAAARLQVTKILALTIKFWGSQEQQRRRSIVKMSNRFCAE
jgi:hypothetical protein